MLNSQTKNIINPPLTRDALDELKTTIIKMLQDNVQDIQSKIIKRRLNCDDIDDSKSRFIKDFKTFVFTEYQIKQKQIDNISSFILNFIASIQEVAEQVSYRDNKILQLRRSLEKATDLIVNLQDENDRFREKIVEAETYIDWIQQEKQFIDLLSLSGQKTLQKCKSQKRFLSNNRIQEDFYLQKSRKKQRVDYSRLKQFINDLKDQKNNLIKQYNILLEKYNLKKNECQRISILFHQFSEKRYNQERFQFTDFSSNNNKFYQTSETQSIFDNISANNQAKQFLWKLQKSSGTYSQEQLTKRGLKSAKQLKNTKKYKYEPIEFYCQQKSFEKEQKKYKYAISHTQVGTNTKRVSYSDKQIQYQQNLSAIKLNDKKQGLQFRNLQSSKGLQKQVTSTKPNSQFDCEISISIKGNNRNMLLNRQFSKFIDLNSLLQDKQKGFTKCKKVDTNKGVNLDLSQASSRFDFQKDVHQHNQLCNHLYCYFTNKIVHDRIKKYKYFKGKGKK